MKCYKCNKRIRFWQKRKARLHLECFHFVIETIQMGYRDGIIYLVQKGWDVQAHKRLSFFQAEMAMIDLKKELGVRG